MSNQTDQMDLVLPSMAARQRRAALQASQDAAIRASFNRFLVYHEDNPHVAKDLAELALRVHRRGHSQYGMAGLMTVLRFRHALVTTGNEAGFKISNNFGPFYSRLLMAHIPDLEDFFATRTSLADGWNWSRVDAPSLSEVE